MRNTLMISVAIATVWLATTNRAEAQKPAAEPGHPVGVPAYPVAADEDLYALIDGAGTTDDHDGADAVVVLDRTENLVEESGLGHVTRRRVWKILTVKGARQLSSLRFDWDPATNFVTLKRAVIHRGGKVAATLGVDKMIDVPQPQHMIYWGARMKLLAVGRLEVGDALEVVTYEKGFRIALLADAPDDEERYVPPMRGHFYAIPLFGDQPYPVLEQHYTVKLGKAKPLQYQVVNGEVMSEVTLEGDQMVYHFWKKGMPPFVADPVAEDDPPDILPKVVMATVPDWQAKSRWFYEVNEGQFEANDAIRAKVAEITKGKDQEQAIAALLHWVAQEIRYSGISMGKGEGYILHSGITTFNDRAGVCKDIAGMLVTMLRAADFTVYPAMTMAGARVEKVPADQFNHCVVALKQKDGSFRMLDPTWAPFSRNTWSNAEREQHFVIGTPEGDTLRIIPAQGADANRLEVTADTALGEDGALKGTITFAGDGYLETRLRRHIIYQPAAELRFQLIRFLDALSPRVELLDYGMTDIRDLDRPFAIRVDFAAPGYAAAGDDLLGFVMPLARNLVRYKRLGLFLTAAETDQRTGDIVFSSTDTRVYHERLTLPRGYTLVGGPIREKVVTPLCDFEATIEQVGGRLELTERIRIHQRRIPKDKLADYHKVIAAVQALANRTLYIERKSTGKGGAR